MPLLTGLGLLQTVGAVRQIRLRAEIEALSCALVQRDGRTHDRKLTALRGERFTAPKIFKPPDPARTRRGPSM